MNKIKNIIVIICVVVIFVAGVYCCYNYYDITEKLKIANSEVADAQQEILSIKNDLNNTTNTLNDMTKQCSDLNNALNETKNNLESANEIISARHGDVYFLDCEVTELEIDMLAKTVWGEARGLDTFQQSMVVWCVLNRVDAGWGSIAEVVTAPDQFHGYNSEFPVDDEIKAMCKDVIARWKLEKICFGSVGRTLPSDYLWFHGDGEYNYFRNSYDGEYDVWNCDCWNPYS